MRGGGTIIGYGKMGSAIFSGESQVDRSLSGSGAVLGGKLDEIVVAGEIEVTVAERM